MSPPLARLVMSYSARIKRLLASVLDFGFTNPFLKKVAVAARLCFCCLPPCPGQEGSGPGESQAAGCSSHLANTSLCTWLSHWEGLVTACPNVGFALCF